MAKPRFYHPHPMRLGDIVTLSDNASAHATRALRLQLGDSLCLFNGDGHDYQCVLTRLGKTASTAEVKLKTFIRKESPLQITLLQGISSGTRMDYTIQKATELGVTSIQALATERSVVKLSAERAEKRLAHWQNIVYSACEQCGRATIPTVLAPLSLSQWLAKEAGTVSSRLLLNPVGATRLADISHSHQSIALLIGAEGGLTEAEIRLASQHGFQSVVLGPRILRTETAALTAITVMQSLWGDF
ncbi:MAG: 16S rRNA (uracil(1498)-N(3))-methyltransferase [Methylotenera sp.]|nr:16S rRNA (uracil(1498)-N(3))-methyltransferase [Methylotenera sp.]